MLSPNPRSSAFVPAHRQRPQRSALVLSASLFLAAAAFAGSAHAGAAEDCARAASEARARDDAAVTVYVDSSWGRRRSGAARALSDCHRAFAAHRYRLVDIELFTENSDVEGFFASYVE
jgi:hypothetical protein